MKPVFVFLFIVSQYFLFAQDTIIKRNGNVIPAKVIEVNITEVSYKRPDITDGPLFIINKNDIRKIKYANGITDSFKIATPQVTNKLLYIEPNIALPNKIQTTMRRGVYKYNGHYVSDRKVLYMAQEKNIVWNNPDITKHIADSQRNKVIQYLVGFGAGALGGAGLYGCAVATGFNSSVSDNAITAGFATVFAGIFVSSQVVSFQYKIKRIKSANKVAELYNTYP